MREWCGCGAGIVGKPKAVKRWRGEHRHPPEPPVTTGSAVEIGFRPGPEVRA